MTRLLYVLLLTGFLLFFAYLLITNALPRTTGTVVLQILDNRVHVYRDSLGIPHIFARNTSDLFRAMGYVSAQDRLWQMDLSRRIASGRLAEIFGSDALETDKFLRVWGFQRIARKIISSMSPETTHALEAYAEGVNAFLTQHSNKLDLPIEFSLLQYSPEPWKPEDSIGYARVMAWKLSFSWFTDLTLQMLVEKLGLQKARQVFPDFPSQGPFILAEKNRWDSVQNFLSRGLAVQDFLGIRGGQMGSNSWVLAGERSVSGYPLLANDPHLELTAPGIWYEIHLAGGEFDVAGVALPGIPAIVIGHNRQAAWGLTNGMLDDVDFYVEKVNPENPAQYWDGRDWRAFQVIEEEIAVKDEKPVIVEILRSRNGVIVSDIHPGLKNDNRAVSMRWTGQDASDELLAYLRLMKATSWPEFTDAVQQFRTPAQNFVFASRDGDIGYYLGGAIPVRDNATGLLPHQGWRDQGQWLGYVPFEQQPHLHNPPQGFIATANNKIVDDSYPFYLSNLWEPDSRVVRIHEWLAKQAKFSLAEFKSLQLDVNSVYARVLLPVILTALDLAVTQEQSEDLKVTLDLLKDWDTSQSAQLLQPSIFHAFLVKIAQNTFEDEMGPELYRQYIALGNVPTRVLAKLLLSGNSAWFDDVNTEDIESKNDIIIRSIRDARQLLTEVAGEDEGYWMWGDIHTLTMKHPLARFRPLQTLLNIGPMPMSGSAMTVNKAEYRFNSPFASFVGPSTRQLVDLGDPLHAQSVISTGQSGQSMSRHYRDQTPLWHAGKYHEMVMVHDEIMQNTRQLLVLEPVTAQ